MKLSKLLLGALVYCIVLLFFNCAKEEGDFNSGRNNDTSTESESALNYISESGKYSMFHDALVRANLTAELDGENPVTVFAPNNDAFQAFLDANNWSSVNDISEGALKTIMSIHVAPQTTFMSTDFYHGQYIQIMFQNREIQVNLDDPAKPQLISGLTKAFMVGMDEEVDNGVIHEIDGVLSL